MKQKDSIITLLKTKALVVFKEPLNIMTILNQANECDMTSTNKYKITFIKFDVKNCKSILASKLKSVWPTFSVSDETCNYKQNIALYTLWKNCFYILDLERRWKLQTV